jgi:hypothetical protein
VVQKDVAEAELVEWLRAAREHSGEPVEVVFSERIYIRGIGYWECVIDRSARFVGRLPRLSDN